MKMKMLLLGCAMALPSFQAANATVIGADQLLGIVVPGTPANPANEAEMVNGMLNGWLLVGGYNDGAASGTVMGNNPNDPQNETYTLKYSLSTVIPAPVLPSAVLIGSSSVVTSDPDFTLGTTTYDWVLAKWGQDSAVYYIRGMTGPLTLTRDGTGYEPEGHGLSGYTLFNPGTNVPDGGTTTLLLGMAMLGLAGVKRMLRG